MTSSLKMTIDFEKFEDTNYQKICKIYSDFNY